MMKNKKCTPYFSMYGDLGLRLVTGLIFILAGIGKLFGPSPGIEGFSGMLTGIGIPAAGVVAVIVGIIELAGGILLIVGYFDKYAAMLLAIIMIVATILVHIPKGWSDFRYPLLLVFILARYVGTNKTTIINLVKNGFKA
ncbi:DoxX family protein [Candidatus Woesearchaeota archaeon]|nr:DoxX family protein [Candidatus Woesearchaeota archaeon]MCF7901331.1 DoxX family protein [Candidatus Woesearchaeota archaeon]MCF8014005.1 DoxX family protein [Candidatus Woesearchaeota archaeon]